MNSNNTEKYMTERSVRILTTEIHNMMENLNTWSVALKNLLVIRRTLLNNPTADQELYDIIDVYSQLYYATYSGEDTQTPRIVKRITKKVENNTDESEVDIDDFLQTVIKEEHGGKEKKLTNMQQAALKVLDDAEQDAKQMDAIINSRRAQMENQMQNPPAKPVKFLTNDVDNNPDESEGEIIEEVEITKEKNTMAEDLENALKTTMSNISNDPTMHPLIEMQKNQSIFTGIQNYDKPPAVKFNTPEIPEFDRKYGPLFSLTAPQRNKLYQRWFKQATINVDSQLNNQPVSPNTRNRLIREETTRMQDSYLESF